ncbi:predicted protein [Coccidioides posadasii str. Silveira]|uniref:Predicted protein n=1 Tax=Coccidioides posadasii (strain RMSCC 757 / Silveira) TaxID=443226 RepID=E9DCW1_COCPS|nr:predicted protein [Coccidioides posadasii str. Silveira]
MTYRSTSLGGGAGRACRRNADGGGWLRYSKVPKRNPNGRWYAETTVASAILGRQNTIEFRDASKESVMGVEMTQR